MRKFSILFFIGLFLSIASFAVSPITGASSVCVGHIATFTDSTSGGTWASSNTAIATVGSTTGIVTGIATGTVTISYITGTGTVTTTISVNPVPVAITGSSTVCVGSTITLTDATPGGTWAGGSTSIATVGSTTGVVAAVGAGITNIYYVVGGCAVYKSVTVNAAPPISGPGTVCVGSSITLTDSVSGGTWFSSTTSVATVGSSSGVVTAVAAGTTMIYYNAAGCYATKIVTVTAAPSAISGPGTVCAGSSITLTDATSGGTWASANTSVATVGSTTGVATGVAAGTVVIYYSIPGCGGAYKIVTVTAAPAAITGSSTVCAGSTITMTDATPGGTWAGGSSSVATIGSASGIVTGVGAGVTNIYYVVGGCGVYKSVTVNAASPISGPGTVCVGSSITLSDSISGGSWYSSTTSVATVGSSSGLVTAVAAGTTMIYYSAGGCYATKIVTVTAAPSAISGPGTVCAGSSITLTDATSGGTWASANTSVATVGSTTGVATGVAAGTVVIYYSIPGCGGSYKIVTVTAAAAAITGSGPVCVGRTITLADVTAGGSWSSGNTALGTVGSLTGIVAGIAPGVLNIYYTLPGCGSVYKTITVNAAPTAIAGSSSVCMGATISLSNSVPGGTWASSNTSVATIGSGSGIVTGVAPGTATIYYVLGGCGLYKIVTVSTCVGGIGGTVLTGSPKGTSGGAPVVGMMIKLKYASTGGLVAQTYTDASGLYAFSGLADDSYYVYPEMTGYTTTPSATINITNSLNTFMNINFNVHNGDNTIVPVSTAVAELNSGGKIDIYPNPTSGNINIIWEGQVMEDATVIVTDIAGHEVNRSSISDSNNSGKIKLQLPALTNGVYLVSIKSEHINYRSRIVVQH